MARPTAPPNTPTALIRSTRLRYEPPRSVIVPSSPPVAGSKPMLGLPTANPVPSGTQIASVARIMSGHGSGAGFGRTSSASQSGTVAARIAAVRALIRAGLRSSLDLPYIACAPPRRRSFYGTDRGNSLRPELATRPALPSPSRRARPWQSSRMEPSRYRECLATDYGALRDAAVAVELTIPVPTEVVRLTGEEAWAGYLRRMLVAVTQ